MNKRDKLNNLKDSRKTLLFLWYHNNGLVGEITGYNPITLDTITKANLKKNKLTINGITTTTQSYMYNNASVNTPLFIHYFNGYQINRVGSFRVYYFKISEDDKESLNLIPALDLNNKPCLYDLITNQAFYNQGKGEDFLYGSRAYNCVGNENYEKKYEIPIELETIDGNKNITIILDEPLRKFEDKADYLDLQNKEVVRLVKQDSVTGDLLELTTPVKETVNIEDIDFNKVISIKVKTEVEPSGIE